MLIKENEFSNFESYENISENNQYDIYRALGASRSVLKLIKQESRRFGTTVEKIIKEKLCISNTTNRTVDGEFQGFFIEIKSSRLWNGKLYKFQHIMLGHNWNVLLLTTLTPEGFVCYAITKESIEDLYNQQTIKIQGGAGGQGLWFTLDEVLPYVTLINEQDDFIKFIDDLK